MMQNAAWLLLSGRRDDLVWRTCGLVRALDFPAVSCLVDLGISEGMPDVAAVDLAGRVNDAFGDMLAHPQASLRDMLPVYIDRIGTVDVRNADDQENDLTHIHDNDMTVLFMSLWPRGHLLAALAACHAGVASGRGLLGVRPDMAAHLRHAVESHDKAWIERHAIMMPPGGLTRSEWESTTFFPVTDAERSEAQ